MRHGTSDTAWLTIGDEFVGVNLGWDFCAEHEWGIVGIHRAFGMSDDPEKFGITRRTITAVPQSDGFGKSLRFMEVNKPKKGSVLLLVPGHMKVDPEGKHYPFDELALWDKELSGAWDEDGFGLYAVGKYAGRVNVLYDAFLRKDIAIYLGKTGPFNNGGLKLVITSKLPKDITDAMFTADEDNYKMRKAAVATGIEAELKAKGKKWFALSPRWKDDSKSEIIFWLNPFHQDADNCGWFTVEQLRQWVNNEGPVPKLGKPTRR